MKVYLKIRVSEPVNFSSDGTAYQAAPGDEIPVHSRAWRLNPTGIGSDAAVRLVQEGAAELVEWGRDFGHR